MLGSGRHVASGMRNHETHSKNCTMTWKQGNIAKREIEKVAKEIKILHSSRNLPGLAVVVVVVVVIN